jgi:hypothetical protein
VGYGGAIGAAVTLAKGNATLAEYLVRPYWQPVGLAILGHVLRKKPKSARFGEAALAVAGYQLGEQLTAGVVEPAAPGSSAPEGDAEGINTFGFDAQGINSFAFADDDDEGQSATAAAAPLQQLPEPAPAVAPTVADAAYMYY